MLYVLKYCAMCMVWLTVICVCFYILLTMFGMIILGLELAELLELEGYIL